jgi:hypothetical protein
MGRGLESPIEAVSTGLKPFFFLTALGDFYVFEKETPLPQRKIKLAVCGGRNAEIVSAFGSMRKESCAIIVLEKPLDGDANKWQDALRARAKKTRTIVDQEVFEFPSLTVMEGVYKQKEWQGTYVSLLAPDTILCATSDRFLEELLERRKSTPKDRALPADLPEWKQIDIGAPAWLLWHPAPKEGSAIQGGGWMWRDDVVEFIYVPRRDAEIAVVEKAWHIRWDDKPVFPAPKPGESLTQRRDGVVVVRVSTKDYDPMRAFTFAILVLAFETGTP